MTHSDKKSLGQGGKCICPKCKTTINHTSGIPCQREHCPTCGAKMLRIGSKHYKDWMKKQGE